MSAQTSSRTGGAEFLLILGVATGISAFVVTLLFVSLPDGLKFVLAALVGMLTLICGGLLSLAQVLDRPSSQ